MAETTNIAFGCRCARDGSTVAIDWLQPDGTEITVYLPATDLPALVGLLLEAASRLGGSGSAGLDADRLLQPADIQLVAPDDGSDWIMRIVFGATPLDLAISANNARALQHVLRHAPQFPPRQPMN